MCIQLTVATRILLAILYVKRSLTPACTFVSKQTDNYATYRRTMLSELLRCHIKLKVSDNRRRLTGTQIEMSLHKGKRKPGLEKESKVIYYILQDWLNPYCVHISFPKKALHFFGPLFNVTRNVKMKFDKWGQVRPTENNS